MDGDLAQLERLLASTSHSATAALRDVGWTPLMVAAAWGRSDIVQRLLPAGMANARDGFGLSALDLATMSEDGLGALHLLLDGERVNAANDGGMTALHWAAGAGNLSAVQALLAAGADAQALTREGASAVALASSNGHAGVAEILQQ